MASTAETLLTIQNFHQCSSLVTLKLSQTNFLLWKSQVLPLIRTLGVQHHLEEGDEPAEMITKEDKETQNPAYTIWLNNDGLLTTWLLGTIEEEILLDLDENCYAHQVWKSIKNKLLPSSKEKEVLLNETLMTLTKGNMSLDECI